MVCSFLLLSHNSRPYLTFIRPPVCTIESDRVYEAGQFRSAFPCKARTSKRNDRATCWNSNQPPAVNHQSNPSTHRRSGKKPGIKRLPAHFLLCPPKTNTDTHSHSPCPHSIYIQSIYVFNQLILHQTRLAFSTVQANGAACFWCCVFYSRVAVCSDSYLCLTYSSVLLCISHRCFAFLKCAFATQIPATHCHIEGGGRGGREEVWEGILLKVSFMI